MARRHYTEAIVPDGKRRGATLETRRGFVEPAIGQTEIADATC